MGPSRQPVTHCPQGSLLPSLAVLDGSCLYPPHATSPPLFLSSPGDEEVQYVFMELPSTVTDRMLGPGATVSLLVGLHAE